MLGSDLQQMVTDYGFGTDTDAQKLRMLNTEFDALWRMRNWYWRLVTTSHLLVVGNGNAGATTPLTAGSRPLKVALRDTASTYVDLLEPLPYDEFLDHFYGPDLVAASTGDPVYWAYGPAPGAAAAIGVNSVYLWPKPVTAATVLIQSAADPGAITAGAEVPAMPPEYHEYLGWRVVEHLSSRERDLNMVAYAKDKADKKLLEMLREQRAFERRGANKVVETGVHSAYTNFYGW